jgi:hypothetical protein
MKNFALSALLLCGLATGVLASQQVASIDRPPEPNFVFDDDGGKAQIVPPDFSVAGPKKFHGGSVLGSPRQVSIFLGAGWGDQQVRSRELSLLDVAANKESTNVTEMQSRNIKTLRPLPPVEDFADLTKSKVNDLTIQRKLSDLLQNKTIPAPASGTVYVIFLAPGIDSTLGAHKAGVDYLAYHNFVNLEAGEIHYVVVPFHGDAQQHASAAARAFAETAMNPNLQGWF